LDDYTLGRRDILFHQYLYRPHKGSRHFLRYSPTDVRLQTGDHTGQHCTIAMITNSTAGTPTTSVLTSSGSVPSVTSTTSTTEVPSSGLSKGADIGVGLGAGIVGITLVGAGLWKRPEKSKGK
jgi:hypothetical protein